MNRDLKSHWQHLRSELQHWGHYRPDDLEWIDAAHDYTRGRVGVQHGQRARSDESRTRVVRERRR